MELPAAAAAREEEGAAAAVRRAQQQHSAEAAAKRLASLVAGGLAAPIVCAPLDLVRTRMQGARARAQRGMRAAPRFASALVAAACSRARAARAAQQATA
jgi:hypothetical protein